MYRVASPFPSEDSKFYSMNLVNIEGPVIKGSRGGDGGKSLIKLHRVSQPHHVGQTYSMYCMYSLLVH